MNLKKEIIYQMVNKELSKYGEYIDPKEECFRAFLAGTLDRLVYDEHRMSKKTAREIESLIADVPDAFEEKYGIRSDGRTK